MKLLILSGPPAAGKNTIATTLAKLRKKCAVIDVDAIRQMIIQPHKAPWEGKEGVRQQQFGIKNACLLAKKFLQQKYDVLILDVLSDNTAKIYKKELKALNPKIILLLPTYPEIVKRNKMRTQWLKPTEIEMLYKQQEQFRLFDKKIDNTKMSIKETAKNLHQTF
jgi:dephospho-CoA kinase